MIELFNKMENYILIATNILYNVNFWQEQLHEPMYLYYSHVQNSQNFIDQLMYLDIIN